MKRFSIVLTVLSLVVGLVSIAAAPMASGTATLTSAVYVEGKGIVFTFHVDGKLSRSELKGSIQVDGGGNYGLDCVQVDDSTVKCTSSRAIAGANVLVTWGGTSFWTKAPQPPVPAEYCYGLYDYDQDGIWKDYGPHCQDTPAQYEEMIKFNNPDWLGMEYEYWFRPEGPECSGLRGDAYYFSYCPEE